MSFTPSSLRKLFRVIFRLLESSSTFNSGKWFPTQLNTGMKPELLMLPFYKWKPFVSHFFFFSICLGRGRTNALVTIVSVTAVYTIMNEEEKHPLCSFNQPTGEAHRVFRQRSETLMHKEAANKNKIFHKHNQCLLLTQQFMLWLLWKLH